MKGSSELEPVQPFTGEGKQMETSMKDTSEGGAVSVGEGKQTSTSLKGTGKREVSMETLNRTINNQPARATLVVIPTQKKEKRSPPSSSSSEECARSSSGEEEADSST